MTPRKNVETCRCTKNFLEAVLTQAMFMDELQHDLPTFPWSLYQRDRHGREKQELKLWQLKCKAQKKKRQKGS